MMYWSRYQVVCLSDSVFLIPVKDIRPVFILNVQPHALGEYILLWNHNPDKIYRKGCSSYAGTPESGKTRWGSTGLVSASYASMGIYNDNLPSWAAPVWWVPVLPHSLDAEWALWLGMMVSTLHRDNVKVAVEAGIL